MLKIMTGDNADISVSGLWTIEVLETDAYGYAQTSTAPTLLLTLPGGTTASPTFALVEDYWRATYTVTTAGRWIAKVSTATDAEYAVAFVSSTTAGTSMPSIADVADYIDSGTWDDDTLTNALNAEAAAQRSVCRVGAVYPDDLRQALLRRVQRNLALRSLPLAVLQGDAEGGSTVLPGRDPEVRRLEAPHRKLTLG